MSQSTNYHDGGVINIAKFLLGGTLINSAQLLGTTDGNYSLVVYNSEYEYEVLDPEKFIELANYIHRLIAEYPASRLQQLASEDAAKAGVQRDEMYADLDEEAQKYRALLEALVSVRQSEDENDLPE